MSQLSLYLFGSPHLERDGISLAVDTRKAIALLAYLAVTGQSQGRDTLAALLWPDYDQSRARAALRRTLSTLNTVMDGESLNIEREAIGLEQNGSLWIDVAQFQRLLAECRSHDHPAEAVCPACLPLLTEAVALYRADFMAGFSLRDSPDFDDWQFFQSESLRQILAGALEKLAKGYAARAEFELAVAYARRWLALDPLHEPAQRQLIQLYALTGQRSAALRQYRECVRVLMEELGASPEAETTALYQAIEEGRFPPMQAGPEHWGAEGSSSEYRQRPSSPAAPEPEQTAPAPQPVGPPHAPVPLHNLPAQTGPFVGREAELKELARLLVEPNCRLITLIGPGGIGKTRLALQVALGRLTHFADGVFFTPLASLDSAELLVPAIARILGFNFYGPALPETQLLHYLRDKEMLLVLDSLEHLLAPSSDREGGVGSIIDILQQAPRIKLLVTSRERLNLQGEWVFELHGLQLPKSETGQVIEAYSATALFLQQASRVQLDFRLTPENRRHIIRICQLVEGVPLAIELAAAWVRLLSCEEIAQEIERNLDFLSVTARDVPERHRSLRAAFDHSWNLLSAEERRALRRLSVFRGGFGREAAKQVTGANLALLSALVDKSLLHRAGTGRYDLHELVRQYAAAHLRDNLDEQIETYDRHCSYYLDWLAGQERSLKSANQSATVTTINREFENIRMAWRWAATQQRLPDIGKVIAGLSWFYEIRGGFQEAVTFFQPAVEVVRAMVMARVKLPPGAQLVLGHLLAVQGWFWSRCGSYEQAKDLLDEGLARLQLLDQPQVLSDALFYRGIVSHRAGEYAQGEALLQESLELKQALGDEWGRGFCLVQLGIIAQARGAYEKAYRLMSEALASSRRVGDPMLEIYNLGWLSSVTHLQGDQSQAQALAHQALTLGSAIGDLWAVGHAFNQLGVVAMARGEYMEAKYLFHESKTIFRDFGARWSMAWALNNLGRVNQLLGNEQEAQHDFFEALAAATAVNHLPIALETLVGIASIRANKGATQAALALVEQVLQHPAMSEATRNRAIELRSELETHLSVEQIEAARAEASLKSLDQVVAEILH